MDGRHLFFVEKIAAASIAGTPEVAAAYLRQFIEHLQASGEDETSDRLLRLFEKKPARKASVARPQGSRVPIDAESALTIADREVVPRGAVKLVMAEANRATISQFIAYVREADRLTASGIGISPTMLLYGPPGTGKTLTARFIASELNLPLVTARSDGLISSYLGSTSKNVRRLFEYAISEPCVLFLDEFDAVAKKRDDNREMGELKRVVISLLQNIDALDKDHVLLAATNHEHLLDPAIWRRFAHRVKLALPGSRERAQLLGQFFGKYLATGWSDALAHLSEGLSGAQLRIAAEDAIRSAIVRGQDMVEPASAVAALVKEQGHEALNRDDLVRHLRCLDSHVFTEAALGKLFGVSQPAIHKVLTKDSANGQQ